jgi:hypothetical protein
LAKNRLKINRKIKIAIDCINWKLEIGNGKLEMGNGKLEIGNGKNGK